MTDDSDLAEGTPVGDDPRVSEDENSPGMSVTDALLYAPLGFMLEFPGQFPKWVERGRNQVGVARMIGNFALQQAPGGADKVSASLRLGLGLDVAEGIALPRPPQPTALVEEPAPEDESVEPAPDVTSLAIPEYESLAASHVVPRLEGLTPAELADLAAFERAHRRRRTVLHRIDELMNEAE